MRRAIRSRVAAALAPTLLLAGTAFALTGGRAQDLPAPRLLASAPFNPMAGNEGYHVFVDNGVELNNTGSIYGAVALGGDLTVGPTNVAYRAPATASSAAAGLPATNATDPSPDTYWQSSGPMSAASPQSLTVDLGTAMTVAVVQLRLPLSFSTRTETLSVQTSTDGATFATAVASTTYTFTQSAAYPNAAVILVSPTVTGRYVRLSITANSAAAAAQVGSLQVFTYRTTSDRTFLAAYDAGTFNPNNEKAPIGLLVGRGVNWTSMAPAAMSGCRRGT